MAGYSFRLSSNVETDCAEDYCEERVPTFGLAPHKSDYGDLRSRDADIFQEDDRFHSGPGFTKDLDTVDGQIDSGFDSVNISYGNRDSGCCDLAGQLEDLRISAHPQTETPTVRDSGLGAIGEDSLPGLSSEVEKDHISSIEDLAYESVNPDEPLPSALQQVFEQDDEGDNYLHLAIIKNQSNIAKQVISVCPSPNLLNIQNHLWQTALHLAVLTNQPEIVRMLVIWGADLEVRDRNGNTPLHLACMKGLEVCIQCLTTPVMEGDLQDMPYEVPTQSVPQDLTIRNYEGESCLHVTLSGPVQCQLKVINYLVNQCGADINTMECKNGRTLLHQAASTNNIPLTDFLLAQMNILVDARTYSGHTPLRLASSSGYQAVAERLITHGADTSQLALDDYDSLSESDDDSMDGMSLDDLVIKGQPVCR